MEKKRCAVVLIMIYFLLIISSCKGALPPQYHEAHGRQSPPPPLYNSPHGRQSPPPPLYNSPLGRQSPPQYREAHGRQSPPPPKNVGSLPPRSLVQTKSFHLSYGALQPGTPACNASIRGDCGRRCTKYNYLCPTPPHYNSPHGKQSPPPPKNVGSPPPPNHGQTKTGPITYRALLPGTPACNAGIGGNCGRRCPGYCHRS